MSQEPAAERRAPGAEGRPVCMALAQAPEPARGRCVSAASSLLGKGQKPVVMSLMAFLGSRSVNRLFPWRPQSKWVPRAAPFAPNLSLQARGPLPWRGPSATRGWGGTAG